VDDREQAKILSDAIKQQSGSARNTSQWPLPGIGATEESGQVRLISIRESDAPNGGAVR